MLSPQKELLFQRYIEIYIETIKADSEALTRSAELNRANYDVDEAKADAKKELIQAIHLINQRLSSGLILDESRSPVIDLSRYTEKYRVAVAARKESLEAAQHYQNIDQNLRETAQALFKGLDKKAEETITIEIYTRLKRAIQENKASPNTKAITLEGILSDFNKEYLAKEEPPKVTWYESDLFITSIAIGTTVLFPILIATALHALSIAIVVTSLVILGLAEIKRPDIAHKMRLHNEWETQKNEYQHLTKQVSRVLLESSDTPENAGKPSLAKLQEEPIFVGIRYGVETIASSPTPQSKTEVGRASSIGLFGQHARAGESICDGIPEMLTHKF